MPPKILDFPRPRKAKPLPTTQIPDQPTQVGPPPAADGLDAVAAYVGTLNLLAMTEARSPAAKLRQRALQQIVVAFGRCRPAAAEAELLCRARLQREDVGYDAALEAAPPKDPLALPLWHALSVARLGQVVAEAAAIDEADLAALSARLRAHAAAGAAKQSGAIGDFKRRHKIGGDVAAAVEGYAAVEAQLAAEALTADDAADAAEDLVSFGKFMKSDYTSPWHVQVVCDALMKCERGEITGLILNLPPRRSKSTNASELFPAWYLGRHPTRDIIIGTHSQTKADGAGRKVRNLMQMPEYSRVFPGISVAADSSAASVFEIVQNNRRRERRGNFRAYGRGVGVAGEGAHILILDDFISELDAYSATERSHILDNIMAFRTRLAPNAVWIVINTRYHEDDVVGVVQRDFKDRAWVVLSLPEFAEVDEAWPVTRPALTSTPEQHFTYRRKKGEVLWPEQFSARSSEQLRDSMLQSQPHKWYGQFQCRPVAATGNTVDVAWFRRYDYATAGDVARRAVRLVASVDTGGIRLRDRGAAAARTAITVWAEDEGGRCALLDVRAQPWIYSELVREVKRCCDEWRPTLLLVEDKAAGTELITDLGESIDWVQTPIEAVMPRGPKDMRMAAASPAIRAGQVSVPAAGTCPDVLDFSGQVPPWLEGYLNEIAHFPHSRFLDMCDSTSQFLNWRRENSLGAGAVAAATPERWREQSPPRSAVMAALAGPWSGRGGGGGRTRGGW